MIPILIRTKDRVDYLYTTLKSLTATLLDDCEIIILDDCSETDEMKKFLYTNESFTIENKGWIDQINNDVKEEIPKNCKHFFNPDNFSNTDIWEKYIGNNLPYETSITGIKDKFTVIQPSKNMGDLCGLYWSIMSGFEIFLNSDRIIILEDDLIFNKNWLNITNFIYNKEKYTKLGLISVYNRDNDILNNPFTGNLYKTTDNIGGVMYMIPRNVYEFLKKNNKIILDIDDKKNIGGDVHLQEVLLKNEFLIYNTNDSYIQHIGIRSSIRPGRFLRFSRSFLQPFAWNEEF